jgi:hypothetical protein
VRRRTPRSTGVWIMQALRALGATGLVLALSGCEAIGTIFRAGMWVGVLMVVAIVAIIAFAAAKLR